MSRLSNPGCMLRASCVLFGALFLPVGISFFFVLHRRFWGEGIGAVAASFAFFYAAVRANDLLGIDEILDTSEISLADLYPDAGSPAKSDADDQASLDQESDS